MDSTGSKKKCISRLLKGADREIAKLLKAAHAQGFVISLSGSRHYKVMTPEGVRPRHMAFTPKTPSDYRARANTRSSLRRLGVELP
jgi:hypothetical protein